jgi:hypothetical protein
MAVNLLDIQDVGNAPEDKKLKNDAQIVGSLKSEEH